MARLLKKLEIEEVRHSKTNQKAMIYYDRNRDCFCATVAETEYTAETKEKLRGQVYTALGDFSGWKWELKILVHSEMAERHTHYGSSGGYRPEASVSFSFWRMEHAKKPNGSIVERVYLDENGLTDSDHIDMMGRGLRGAQKKSFAETRAHMNRSSRNSGQDLRERYDPHDRTKILDFKQEIWDALHAIKDRIELARLQLAELVKAEDLEQKLLQISMAQPLAEGEKVKLLAARASEDDDDE